ncbi:MAG: Gfo/Idh/MocA family oxidoreductase [Armatimonadota bacterium]|nr:MAG: Gfo/Idh/MocA family oxidoreductase [Armatimonadota bacterium]
MSESKTRIGVIGTGGISSSHVRPYAGDERVSLVGMADVDMERAERAAAEFGGRAYDDHAEMLDAEHPEAVSICTPPVAHKAPALECIKRGIHVLCEKPLAYSADEAREMVEAARGRGVMLMTAFCHRFHEPVMRARALIAQGRLGRILMYRNRFGGRIPMEGRWFGQKATAGGGALLDTSIHSADLFRFLVGEAGEVRAVMDTMGQGVDVEDSAAMLLRSRDGAIGVIEASWCTPYGVNDIEIYGETGAAIVDYDRNVLRYRVDGMKTWRTVKPKGADRFSLEVRHFVDCVRGERQPEVTGEDGLKAQLIIEAAYRSAAEGICVKL